MLNFLLDFMILYGTKRILKINGKIVRIVLGSFVGASTTFVLFVSINSFQLIIYKIILSLIIIFVSFGTINYIRNIIYFYLISSIIGGVIYLFDLNGNYYFNCICIVILSPLIIYLVKKELFNYKTKYQNKYCVSIYYKDKLYKLDGFIDTGNRLISPIKKEAIILTNLNITFNDNKIIYVPYKALNTSGVIPCFRPDKVIVDKIEVKNCLVGISYDKFSLDGSNCILPNIIKEELC